MSKLDISVVVCSYNRADSLVEAIESIVDLETHDFTYEIVVIDNASTDHTKDAVQQVAKKSACPIRYVMESQPGVSFARNRGVQESESTWIAFFDDDELAEPDWLLQLIAAAEKHQVKCVGGGVRLKFSGGCERILRPWVRVMFGCTQGLTAELYDGKRVPGGGNMLVHKDVFEKIGLFRTDLIEGGEDTDLYHRMKRAGFEAYHAPLAVIHHQIPTSRLGPKYLCSVSMRMGSHIARREFENYGRLKFSLVVLSRLLQTSLLHVPQLLLAKLIGDQEMILERNCYWWMWKHYFQAAFRFLAPSKELANALDFRHERKVATE